MRAFVAFFMLAALCCAAGGASQQYDGRTLYAMHCASCHGMAMEGGSQAPPLLHVDAGMVDFMLRTGRMPAMVPWEQEYRHRPQFTEPQIAALDDYVMSHSTGERSLPDVTLPPAGYGLRKGRLVFEENCEQCHGAGGHGDGAVGYHNVAPSIMDDSPREIAEAVREGPDVMPKFGRKIIDDEGLANLVAYVGYLQHAQYNPGGMQLANLGPVAEGFMAWTFGMGILVLLIRRIGETE
ncbi:MAG TPA: c-type cytochrome [Candidatus Baltobacteraceae bacterium]|nr:c-type cytochrome [Candidatus Baltobacteraceae bacterium]